VTAPPPKRSRKSPGVLDDGGIGCAELIVGRGSLECVVNWTGVPSRHWVAFEVIRVREAARRSLREGGVPDVTFSTRDGIPG
jgi:hypothetical protein